MRRLAFLAVILAFCVPASAYVFDNSVAYRWGDPFGDPTDHYAEVEPGDTIALQVWVNDLDGQAWVNATNGGIVGVYGDDSVVDYAATTDDRTGNYYSSYMPYTQAAWSGAGYWYLDYMGTTTRWVAEDRMIITLNITIRPDAPTGPTYVGLQHTFVWWYNYWVDRTTFFDDRIDDSNDPAYRMQLMVTGGLPGDFDSDGDVDTDDIDILCNNMGDAGFDLDGDGDADEDDLTYLVENLAELTDGSGRVGTKQGDFNLDGLVNATDLATMAANFGATPPPELLYGDGNANCDELVNATDLAILASNFGYIAPAGAVPEPITVSLLGVGGLALLRRRK